MGGVDPGGVEGEGDQGGVQGGARSTIGAPRIFSNSSTPAERVGWVT
jgi:hypothetical protein